MRPAVDQQEARAASPPVRLGRERRPARRPTRALFSIPTRIPRQVRRALVVRSFVVPVVTWRALTETGATPSRYPPSPGAVPTSDPGRIAARAKVPLPDRRDLAIKQDKDFPELSASLEDIVRARHRGTASKGSGT